jgi:serine/threonine protein kinase
MQRSPESLGQLGRYELLERLGSGGMGEVFLARLRGAEGFETRVAIKRILPHLAHRDDFAQRFIAEGRLLVSLKHSAIAQVLDMGRTESGDIYLAMEYVEGRDLREAMRIARMAETCPSVAVQVHIVCRVLEALHHAHIATDAHGAPLGIIHRDLSPSNVMLSRSGDVKLVDFGVARASERLALSRAGALHGKFSYMSPEQAAGEPLDARSDQFSAGVLLWELLTGSRPFDGDTDLKTLERVKSYDPGSLTVHLSEERSDLAAVVDRMLSKSPSDRYASCHEAFRALQSWLQSAGCIVGAHEVSAWFEAISSAAPNVSGPESMSVDALLAAGLSSALPDARPVTATFLPEPARPTPIHREPSFEDGLSVPVMTTQPVTVTATSHPTRTTMAILLVAANILLLATVGWLLWDGSSLSERTAAHVALPQDMSEAGPPARMNESPSTSDPSSPVLAPKTMTNAVSDAEQAVDARPSVSAAADQPIQEKPPSDLVTTRIEVRPSGAEVFVEGLGAGPAPRRIELPAGETREVTVRLAGYQTRRMLVGGAEDAAMTVVLKADVMGRVTFRYFPANARVLIDGRAVPSDGSNVVSQALPVGRHYVTLIGEDGSSKRTRFVVEANQETNLATLKLAVP